jgi:hypothetical protein
MMKWEVEVVCALIRVKLFQRTTLQGDTQYTLDWGRWGGNRFGTKR